jgi:HSP20 family protein
MATAITHPKESAEVTRPEATYQRMYVPRFDIWETEDELLLYGDLPGVGPEQLDIHFESGELTIHGKVATRHDGRELVDGEYGTGDFHRTFAIGEAIAAEKISAELRHGVVILHLPKSEKVKPRRIQVKAS